MVLIQLPPINPCSISNLDCTVLLRDLDDDAKSIDNDSGCSVTPSPEPRQVKRHRANLSQFISNTEDTQRSGAV